MPASTPITRLCLASAAGARLGVMDTVIVEGLKLRPGPGHPAAGSAISGLLALVAVAIVRLEHRREKREREQGPDC